MLYPVILAGGVGSRLWPLSRAALPKQFIQFPERQASLFQETLQRLQGLSDVAEPIVVCNEEHRFLVAEQLRQLGYKSPAIILEPVGRNTAPAVAIAALWACAQDADASLLVLPADHVIRDVETFQTVITSGRQLCANGSLVTFGIVPGSPETGYGYIKRGDAIDAGAFGVASFVEKPDLDTAQSYLESGDYYWNSGMFMFRAGDYLEELDTHAADIAAACRTSHGSLIKSEDFLKLPEAEFAACRSDSIDYAVMEKTQRAAVIPLDAGWNDLGAWDALWDASSNRDAEGNVTSGDVLTSGVENSYIQAGSRLVAAVGLKDTVVVETPDAVLVADKARAQDVKAIVEQLQQSERPEAETHSLVYRPWGSYQSLAQGGNYQVKHIIVHPGAALSLQMHHHRAEHWTVIRGTGIVTLEDQEHELHVNESIFIPLGSKHRLANTQDEPVEIIEVQVGDYLGEDDIVRFEDRYGRTS